MHEEQDNKYSKKVFLPANIFNILSWSVSVKYKDHESPTVICTIGSIVIEKTLLDLGIIINFLPYSVY